MILLWESKEALSLEQQRSLALEMLEDALFSSRGKELAKLQLARTQQGKPYFLEQSDLHFSISHCDDAVVLFLSGSPCGIDIEKIRPMSPEAAHIVLSQEEKLLLAKTQEKDRYFFALWVLKESLVKCLGQSVGPKMKRYPFDALFQVEIPNSSNQQEKLLPFFQVEHGGILCSLYFYGEHMVATAYPMPQGQQKKESIIQWKREKKKA